MIDAVTVPAGDSVATLLRDGHAGDEVEMDYAGGTLTQDVPPGHQITHHRRAAGSAGTEHGYPVGRTTRAIVGYHADNDSEKSAAERDGEREIGIWKNGVTL